MKICALDGCNNEVKGRADKKFCSEACRKEKHNADKRNPVVERVCANPDCDNTFLTTTESRVYCDDIECKIQGKNAKRALRQSKYLHTAFTSTDVDSFWAGRLCADWQSKPLIQV